MAERMNGKAHHLRRTHGSERRGVFSEPSSSTLLQRQQSQRDKEQLLAAIKQRHIAAELDKRSEGIGNKTLPAYRHKQEILDAIESHKAIILGGPTGSGKSTQVPQYLYEAGYDQTFVLVPRRVIADGLSDRIQDELTEQLGGERADNLVGVMHGEGVRTHENNRITVMTPQTFNIMESQIREDYDGKKVAIISDEIHEANLFTEIATGVAGMAVRDNDSWRLIAASATHNAESLKKPLGRVNEPLGTTEVPVVSIEGRPFNVDIRQFPDGDPIDAYLQDVDGHEKTMIFTSGKKEIDFTINEVRKRLEKKEKGSSQRVVIRKLHGQLTGFELSHINDPIPDGHSLLVVSSPAGMSGITIPGVTRVLADGTINREMMDEDGLMGLERHPMSQSEIIQVMGRAGRDVSGGVGYVCAPINIDGVTPHAGEGDEGVTQFQPLEERQLHAEPEIYNSNLSRVVLTVADIGRKFVDVNEFIPNSVSRSPISNAEETLANLGAFNDEDVITPIGHAMNKFPITPELARGVVEAERRGRSLRHLAYVALTAAAVDAGGMQNYDKGAGTEWRKLIQYQTDDDFMAQLDLMIASRDAIGLDALEYDRTRFAVENDLHPKRLERAHKLAKKIFQRLNVDPNNLVIDYPNSEEVEALRTDFTAGMYEQVYEPAEMINRQRSYRHVRGEAHSKRRFVSSRSIVKPSREELLAGTGRWYKKKLRSGKYEIKNIIEMNLKVTPEVVGYYALQNNVTAGHIVGQAVTSDGVVEYEQQTFGSILVGKPEVAVQREFIPEKSQDILATRVLERPGEAQRALRAIADELERYHETIPPEELEAYRQPQAPEEVTKAYIEKLVRQYVARTRRPHEVDSLLAAHSHQKNLTISRYFDIDAREEMTTRSPRHMVIAGNEVELRYSQGRPYVTNLSKAQRRQLRTPVFLDDGREVFLQVSRDGQKHHISLSA